MLNILEFELYYRLKDIRKLIDENRGFLGTTSSLLFLDHDDLAAEKFKIILAWLICNWAQKLDLVIMNVQIRVKIDEKR